MEEINDKRDALLDAEMEMWKEYVFAIKGKTIERMYNKVRGWDREKVRPTRTGHQQKWINRKN